MTKKEAEAFIEEINQYGISPGLENIRELCRRLGDPQEQLSFVHIAGTNGKGSVLKLVSDACKESGIRTGCYLSPVLLEYRERFQINGRMIPRRKLYAYLEHLQRVCTEMVQEGWHHPTAFEMETALAFLYFKEEQCDLVVLETGMGGDLDATNIISKAKVVVFTSISMDHMAFLGNSLAKIASRKAGILKKGAKVVCYPSPDEVLGVLRQKAAECGISKKDIVVTDKTLLKQVKYRLKGQQFSYKEFDKMKLGLAGGYQIINAAVALDVLAALKELGYDIKEAAVRKAFERASWSGRMEVIGEKPTFIMDGAHNEDAAGQLAQSIELYLKDKRIIYIMGVLRDKDHESMIQKTCRYASHIITVKTPDNPRAMDAYELAKEISRYHGSVTTADSLTEAVEMAYLLADKDSVILAFGSLSYLGALKEIVLKRNEEKKKTMVKI